MNRHCASRARLSLVALGTFLLGATGAPAQGETAPGDIPYEGVGSVPLLSVDYGRSPYRVILVTDHGVRPRSVNLVDGERVVWLSSSRASLRVVFEREVVRSMRCHSVVNFQLIEDELRSAELGPGDIASFCELAPGRYRYSVRRRALGPLGPARLEGEIRVTPDPLTAPQR